MIATAPAPSVHRPTTGGAEAPLFIAAGEENAIALLRPPYDRIEHQTGWSSLDGRPGIPGLIAGIQLDRPLDDCAELDLTIRRLRHRCPATPVVLLLHLPPEDGLFVAAPRARRGAAFARWCGPGSRSATRCAGRSPPAPRSRRTSSNG
jgi:hypothetical protein